METEELPIFDKRDLQRSMFLVDVGGTVSKVYARSTRLSVYSVLEATNQIMKDFGFRCEVEIEQHDSLILVRCRKDSI